MATRVETRFIRRSFHNNLQYMLNRIMWTNTLFEESSGNYLNHSPAELGMRTWTEVWHLRSCRIPYFAEFLKPDATNHIYIIIIIDITTAGRGQLMFSLSITDNYSQFLRADLRSHQTNKHTRMCRSHEVVFKLNCAHFPLLKKKKILIDYLSVLIFLYRNIMRRGIHISRYTFCILYFLYIIFLTEFPLKYFSGLKTFLRSFSDG